MKKTRVLSAGLVLLVLTTAVASASQRVFITPRPEKADFGTLDGADERCQDKALAAGLTGDWVAWISDSSTDARDRINGNGPFVLMSGQTIANNRADLLDGELAVPIDIDPTGRTVTNTPLVVWTGTEDDGLRSQSTCSSWTEMQEAARIGHLSTADWSANEGQYKTYKCGWGAYLYCFEKANDRDADDDGVLDAVDACPSTASGETVNTDGCSIADLCPCDHQSDGESWKNHGAYVSCVAQTAGDFIDAGLITAAEKGETTSAAGQSGCGKKH